MKAQLTDLHLESAASGAHAKSATTVPMIDTLFESKNFNHMT